jgi:DNA-binding NarL/FixJ family response regulator
MADAPIRTMVVDDHPEFLRAAAEVVRATPGFESVGEAGCADDAIDLVSRLHPDLALVDVHMPGVDGIELTRRIKAIRPETVVALISADDEPDLPTAVAGCGADRLLRKQEFGPGALRRLRPR